MKSLLLIALTLFSASTVSARVMIKPITTETDRFTGVTSTTYSKFDSNTNGYAIAKNSNESLLMFGVMTTSDTWEYLRCESQNWLLDGKPYDLADGKYRNSVGRGYVSESLFLMLTAKDVQAFASASKIEYKLCNNEFVVPQDVLEAFKQIATIH